MILEKIRTKRILKSTIALESTDTDSEENNSEETEIHDEVGGKDNY